MDRDAEMQQKRCAMSITPSAPSSEGATIKYVCGIDIGSQSCAGCITRPDKSVVLKPITFANAREGWQIWEEKLNQLDAPPSQILIGMEATSRDARKSLSRGGRSVAMFCACYTQGKPITFTSNRVYGPRLTHLTPGHLK